MPASPNDSQSGDFKLPFTDPIGGYDEVQRRPGGVSYLRNGEPHRLDGPARQFQSGSEAWYVDGEFHRVDGPARTFRSYRTSAEKYRHFPPRREGTASPSGRHQWLECWYSCGLLSRVDGPAIQWQDGAEEWFYRQRRHRVGGPAVSAPDGLREWHQIPPEELEIEIVRDPNFYRLQGVNNYFREQGPTVIAADGTRFWGTGSVAGMYYPLPASGPWVEHVDGSVDFVERGEIRRRAADHPFTISLRREGRQYVASKLARLSHLLQGASFLPFEQSSAAMDGKWREAEVINKRRYASGVRDWWEEVQGNLGHDDDKSIAAWLEIFEATSAEEREEIRMLRENMQGYLKVALRLLDGMDPVGLDELQGVVTAIGLPLTDAVTQLTSESRLLRAAVTAPSRSEAIAPSLVPFPRSGQALAKPKPRPIKVVNDLYVRGMAELALATLAAICRSDGVELSDTVLLNVMVDEVDSATGHDKRFCALSIQVERSVFEAINLDRVDPMECVRSLGAVVPRGAAELAPVRPIIAFDKEDARVIAAVDVASRLDSRANLMELSPNEFESLIQNLFTKIGLDTHQTQASRDGGVDAIAYDSRPIFGGKIIIQAKRYKNTVGVSAVRDLWGTVMNEGASKGLLVTTSGYGKSSFEFAKNKPLELLEGGHLLHLLHEHLGMDAVIVPPATWVDPVEEEHFPR